MRNSDIVTFHVLSRTVVSTLHNPMDCSPWGFSMGFSQQEYCKWVAISSSRGSSPPRDRTQISCVSCIAGRFFSAEPPGKAQHFTEKAAIEMSLNRWIGILQVREEKCHKNKMCLKFLKLGLGYVFVGELKSLGLKISTSYSLISRALPKEIDVGWQNQDLEKSLKAGLMGQNKAFLTFLWVLGESIFKTFNKVPRLNLQIQQYKMEQNGY